MENKDPILLVLARIEAKTDLSLKNQDLMAKEIAEIHKETKRTAAVIGGVSGAVGGGIVSVGWQLLKAKMGF